MHRQTNTHQVDGVQLSTITKGRLIVDVDRSTPESNAAISFILPRVDVQLSFTYCSRASMMVMTFVRAARSSPLQLDSSPSGDDAPDSCSGEPVVLHDRLPIFSIEKGGKHPPLFFGRWWRAAAGTDGMLVL